MKKSMSMLMLVVLSVLLCGCNSKVPDLTPEQTALISEYATHLLVKHSELSERNLLNERELEAGIAIEEQERERQLKAEEIDVKVGSISKKGYSLLLYKNASIM